MSDIIKQVRVLSGKASFLANQQWRLQKEKSRLSALQKQEHDQIYALGEATWALFVAGQITDAGLLDLCRKIQSTQTLLTDQVRIIEAINQEQPPEAPRCVACNAEIDPASAFCPQCGAKVASTPAPVPAAVGTNPVCPHCGKPLRSGAAFCAGCGQKVKE